MATKGQEANGTKVEVQPITEGITKKLHEDHKEDNKANTNSQVWMGAQELFSQNDKELGLDSQSHASQSKGALTSKVGIN